MLETASLVYLFVDVNDLERSRRFYEEVLSFRLLEEDSTSAKYDAGEVILVLNQASDYSVEIAGSREETSIIVFYTDNLDAMRVALERRGVVFDPTLRYEIGATAAFYDPDGHCITIYEPSEEAMTWPSGNKLRSILEVAPLANSGRKTNTGDGESSTRLSPLQKKLTDEPILGSEKMVYLFLYVRDADEAYEFYHKKLGLRVLEVDEEAGVIKYDVGGLILSTHVVGGDAYCAVWVDMERQKSVAPVFHVSNIESVFQELSDRGVGFTTGVSRSTMGALAKFTDPDGHPFYIYEPAPEVLEWPGGARLKQLIARNAESALTPEEAAGYAL